MEAQRTLVQRAEPRTSVQVTFPDGTILEGPIGTPLEVFVQAAEEMAEIPRGTLAVAATVDGLLRELTMPVTRDISVKPVTTDTGMAAASTGARWPFC